MSWLFSRVLVEEYLEDNCLDGALFAQLSGTPTPQAYLPQDKMTDFSRPSRFGMTFAPLTEQPGTELLTWFLAGFPAKTSAQLAKVSALTAKDQVFGKSSQGSFARYDRDLSLWKIHQCSLFGDSDEYSETWPRWGTMRNGECWERMPLERRTEEIECGLWHTPNVPNGGRSVAHVTDWRGKTAYHNGKKVQVGLEAAVKMWPTPTAVTNTGGAALCKWGGSGTRAQLRKMVTPQELNGALNPVWVEWLMGWPQGWTDLQPLVTDKYLNALLKHG